MYRYRGGGVRWHQTPQNWGSSATATYYYFQFVQYVVQGFYVPLMCTQYAAGW
jgi:hypothetical protein